LVRREVFESVGLFDESFFMYFEDVEFSRRVGAHFRMVYTPKAIVYHRSGGGDRWAAQTPTYLYYMSRNRFIAFRSEPAAYRTYLGLVGLASATAKTVPIVARGMATGSQRHARQQLKSLWGGLVDGLRWRKAPDRHPTTQGTAHQ
jgi:GT2 family glycosyltransferase